MPVYDYIVDATPDALREHVAIELRAYNDLTPEAVIYYMALHFDICPDDCCSVRITFD